LLLLGLLSPKLLVNELVRCSIIIPVSRVTALTSSATSRVVVEVKQEWLSSKLPASGKGLKAV
ncbi:hypothetical protein Dimus_037407, partial [Dionaea muscipula]